MHNAYIFADDPSTNWEDFISLYKNIISGEENDGIVLTDRLLNKQKTNFEFYATQKELNFPVDIGDIV